MIEKKLKKKNLEEILEDKKGGVAQIKAHKFQLMLAGVGTATSIVMFLGVKNKEIVVERWELLKEEFKKGSPLSEKCFNNSSLEELRDTRKIVQRDYMNPKLDIDYRDCCRNLLFKFDKDIGEKEWKGQEHGYPVHSKNGWHLSSDD